MTQNELEGLLMMNPISRASINESLAETLEATKEENTSILYHNGKVSFLHDTECEKHLKTRKSKYKKADFLDKKHLELFKSSKNGFVKTDDPFIKAYYNHESYRMNSESAKVDITEEKYQCNEAENDCEYNIRVTPSFSGICKAKRRSTF